MRVFDRIKETLFQLKKRQKAFWAFMLRRCKRSLFPVKLNVSGSYEIPIVINNRNRFTYLKNLIDWLRQSGYHNITVLDNDSDYPPLIDYYRASGVKVLRLGKNVGYKALWQSDFFKSIKNGYYVYTDPDLLPNPDCPKDIVFQLYRLLRKYPEIEKCGPALKIDDIPDHYSHKQEVVHGVEGKYWTKPVEKDVYDAPIDTTFALYKPFAKGNAEECRAYRLGGVYCFKHLPWYENSSEPNEETQYYARTASSSSSWYNRNTQ